MKPDVGEVMRRALQLSLSQKTNGYLPAYAAEQQRKDRVRVALRPVEPIVDVTCPECGDIREVRGRQARRIASGIYSGRCRSCRMPSLEEITTTEDYHEFWRSRFSQAELDSMWQGISLYLRDLPMREAA